MAPWVYVGINAPLVAAIFLLPRYHLYLWGLLSLGSAAAIVVGVARNRPTHPMAWLFVVAGVTTFALGDITYDVLTEFLHRSNPFPSLADVFYLATYVFLSVGMVTMVRARRRRDGETGALLDALIITSGLGVLSWIFLVQPYVHAANMTLFAKLTSIAYPLGDILLLCVLVRLVFGGGTRNDVTAPLGDGSAGSAGRRLRLWLDPVARIVEGGRSHRPGVGALLRVLGRRRAAPGHARAHGGIALATPATPAHVRLPS